MGKMSTNLAHTLPLETYIGRSIEYEFGGDSGDPDAASSNPSDAMNLCLQNVLKPCACQVLYNGECFKSGAEKKATA